ncbi:MAG: hypothetical protein EA341_13955 [Mongoliibacter sp.]|uniref:hypothetical protein n=1 Tax=Mongoliibacter sp. TaxID=2022438 RepID=UPI0012EEF147|nr:hypothetical protein [Mongoliibacter sp.]TVP46239.1 MAG: hypothetical protein EA341_13955 [Mongoliibacter sp.]
MTHFLLYLLPLFWFLQSEHSLEGKWNMYRSETFENILTSKNFQLQDEESRQAIAETFSKVIDGYFYDFKKDTVIFTNYSNFEIHELKGIWWTDGDTLIIGRLDKISVQKYFISKLDEKELHLQLIVPRQTEPSKSRLMFKKE